MPKLEKRLKLPADRSESEIVQEILRYLAVAPNVIAWRMNVGAAKAEHKGKQRVVRFGMKGMADITGIVTRKFQVYDGVPVTIDVHPEEWTGFRVIQVGQRLEIEVKRPGKLLTTHQHAFLETVRRAGGIGIVASSVEDVRKALGG